jgi:hypothetical protein
LRQILQNLNDHWVGFEMLKTQVNVSYDRDINRPL